VKFYGSSLGEVKLTRTSMLIANVIAVEKEKYSILFGLGFEQTKLDNAVSIGGFPVPTSVNKQSVVFQFAGRYRLSERMSLEAGYRLRNVKETNQIPYVPDLDSARKSSMFFRGSLKLF
jgi:type II secretory pathway component PulC